MVKSSVKRVEIPVSSFTGAVFKSYPAVSESINFKVKNGVLTDTVSFMPAVLGSGGEQVSLPEDFDTVKAFSANTVNGERLVVCGRGRSGEGEVYAFNPERVDDGFVRLEGVNCESACFTTIYRDEANLIAFTPGDGRLFLYDGVSVVTSNCPVGAVDICTFKEKTVVLTSDCLYVSSEDPLYFEYEDEFIFPLPAGVYGRRCVLFGNEVVIFGTRGVARLTLADFGRALILRPVCSGIERIYPETAAASGRGVYVLSENGMAVFEGVELIYSRPESVACVEDGIGGFFANGEYHAIVKTSQNAQKQAILSYTDEGVFASDSRILGLAYWENGKRLLAIIEGKHRVHEVGSGYVSPSPVRRVKTCACDFEVNGQKTVTAFSLRSQKDVTVRITADGIPHTFVVRGGRGIRTVCPYLTGREFIFEIIFEGIGAEISRPTVTVEYVEEGV